MATILFVCTGNVCRSPMAVGLLQHRLAKEELADRYRVFSAGVWALDGKPASESAVAVMAERGIDITRHIAHTINADDMAQADLILAMAREQQQMLCNTWPQYAWKTHRLGDLAGRRRDIDDPYHRPLEAYRACADIIAESIDRALPRLLDLL